MHVAQRLLDRGDNVVGIDNLNDYYDPQLKQDRLALLTQRSNFNFHQLDIADRDAMATLFHQEQIDKVVHLAAQAGVRYSLINPNAYIDSNLVGFANVIEACRHHHVAHLVYASSSSVYGGNKLMPFSEQHSVDHPVSLYAATKKSNEMFAHSYAHLYNLPCTGLRFFTVYGPWGRPDMALFKFTKAIFEGRPVEVYNHGKMKRDFTYVDDIIDAMIPLMDQIPKSDPNWNNAHPDPSTSSAPYRLFNIGNNQPTELSHFIEVLEQAIGKKADLKYLPMQPGDVLSTYADVDSLANAVGFRPKTDIQDGIAEFVRWYREYYGV